jgi:hypothetical protein
MRDINNINNTLKLVTKIYKVTKGKKHVSITWVNKETRDFFFKTQVIKEYKYKYYVSN